MQVKDPSCTNGGTNGNAEKGKGLQVTASPERRWETQQTTNSETSKIVANAGNSKRRIGNTFTTIIQKWGGQLLLRSHAIFL